MSDPNPYASPAAPGPGEGRRRTHQYRSRMHAVRGEFWRGMKFGGKWMAASLLVLWLLLCVAAVAACAYRSLFERKPDWAIGKLLELLPVMVGALVAIALTSFYAAIIGGLIMAVAAAINYRKPAAGAASSEARVPGP